MLSGRVGQHVVLGVRPEHLHLRPSEAVGSGCPMAVKMSVVEPLGNDMDVYAESRLGQRVIARVEAEDGFGNGNMAGTSEINMFVDSRKIHFFEPGDTGMNLSLTPGTTTHEPTHAIA
jgi:ABC-type sugar transport system ATPase subunit